MAGTLSNGHLCYPFKCQYLFILLSITTDVLSGSSEIRDKPRQDNFINRYFIWQ